LKFKNKWDSLKRNYTIFMELKNVATSIGWNEDKQIVDASNEWWEEHLVVSVSLCWVFSKFILNAYLT
jgi:hypothetical protein